MRSDRKGGRGIGKRSVNRAVQRRRQWPREPRARVAEEANFFSIVLFAFFKLKMSDMI